MAKRKNKWKYFVILQKNYNGDWEDIEEFESNSMFSLSTADSKELKRLKKEYRISDKYPQRVIYRKIKN